MKKRPDPKKKDFSVDPADSKFPDVPLSVRVSPAMAARMEAAARELGLDRSEFMRYAVVRLILKTPEILESLKSTGNYLMEFKQAAGTPLKKLPVSPEELNYMLQYRGEENTGQLHEIFERLGKLEERAKKE